jgi:hypothetical protein
MSDSRFNEDGSFTDEHKKQVLTHPVVSEITLLLIRLYKSADEVDENQAYKALLDEIPNSSAAFFAMKAEAFDCAEVVQHGFHMLNSMLHQFFPAISVQKTIEETYIEINQIFWGVYFLRAGEDGAKTVAGNYNISPVEAGKKFALEFWRFGEDAFPPTIEVGYRFLNSEEIIEKYAT